MTDITEAKAKYKKVLACFFASPNSICMNEGEVGYDKELREAFNDEAFWLALAAAYAKAHKQFVVRVKLLTNNLNLALAAKSVGYLHQEPIDDKASPDHPQGPRTMEALENAILQKERSLHAKHRRNRTPEAERKADFEELKALTSKLKQRMLIKTVGDLWDELQRRANQLRRAAIVINRYTSATMPDPVCILQDSVAEPSMGLPTCYAAPEPEDGPEEPMNPYCIELINHVLGIETPDNETDQEMN